MMLFVFLLISVVFFLSEKDFTNTPWLTIIIETKSERTEGNYEGSLNHFSSDICKPMPIQMKFDMFFRFACLNRKIKLLQLFRW